MKTYLNSNEGELPQSGKANRLPGSHRVPKKLDPRRNTPRHIIITLPKMKQKERILEAAREKETVTYKGVPIRLSADFSSKTKQNKKPYRQEGAGKKYLKS